MGNTGGKADGGVLLHVHGDQGEIQEVKEDSEKWVERLLEQASHCGEQSLQFLTFEFP